MAKALVCDRARPVIWARPIASIEVMGRIAVRVQARASRDEIGGERAGAILIRVTAPPVDGRANEAVCRLVATRLGVARSRVSVARGASARDKLLEVEGLDSAALRRALAPES